mmetsp:Transcript_2082/g.4927  ORF Transcript_2082/g.4927 Transcript_2082/m.4927 type:complete len:209 (+) Transcript_2082:335-961(+)
MPEAAHHVRAGEGPGGEGERGVPRMPRQNRPADLFKDGREHAAAGGARAEAPGPPTDKRRPPRETPGGGVTHTGGRPHPRHAAGEERVGVCDAEAVRAREAGSRAPQAGGERTEDECGGLAFRGRKDQQRRTGQPRDRTGGAREQRGAARTLRPPLRRQPQMPGSRSVPAAAGGRREHARGKGGLDSAHLGMLDELRRRRSGADRLQS